MNPNKSQAELQFDVKHANEMELTIRELMRRSHDTIRVYNPLDTTFSFMYDRFWHRVPAKSFRDMDRYLAMKFYKNIAEKMIGDQIRLKGQELIDLRIKQFGTAYKDHYEENVEVWDRTPKLNDPELLAQVFKTVIIGVVSEFGMEQVEQMEAEPIPQTDYRPLHEQMFDNLTPLSATSELPATVEELQGIQEEVKPVEAPVYKSKATLAAEKAELEKEALNENKE